MAAKVRDGSNAAPQPRYVSFRQLRHWSGRPRSGLSHPPGLLVRTCFASTGRSRASVILDRMMSDPLVAVHADGAPKTGDVFEPDRSPNSGERVEFDAQYNKTTV